MDLKNIDMIVEIPQNTNIKYEFDKKSNRIRCDRILSGPLVYPGNYGYIPKTLSLDNDPLDILLIKSVKLYPNTLIKVQILGVLMTEDENGMDEKIIAIPDKEVFPGNDSIDDINDIESNQLEKIKYFFTHYKDSDKFKWVKVGDLKNKLDAEKIIMESHQRYLNSKNKLYKNALIKEHLKAKL